MPGPGDSSAQTLCTVFNLHDTGVSFPIPNKPQAGRALGFRRPRWSKAKLAEGMPVRVEYVPHDGRNVIVKLDVPQGVYGCVSPRAGSTVR